MISSNQVVFDTMSDVLQMIPMDMLQKNESGRIVEIVGPHDWKHRLQELGLRDGAIVRVVKPGTPSIIAIDGHRFSFRSDPNTVVLVELLPA